MELPVHLAGHLPSPVRWPSWRRCHLGSVTCETLATISNPGMWDRWKGKHRWTGGRLSSTLFFTVRGCGEGAGCWRACVLQRHEPRRTVHAAFLGTCPSRWTLKCYLQRWWAGALRGGGSAAVEAALKLRLTLCFQEHVTF